MRIFESLKEKFLGIPKEEIEIDDTSQIENKKRILIKEFVIKDLSKIESILNLIKIKPFIAIINFKPLIEKNEIGFVKAIKKFKEFSDSVSGDIVFINKDWLVLTSKFIEIYRERGF